MWPFNSILCEWSDIFFSWSCWWKWYLCDYVWGNNYYSISHGKTWPVRPQNYKIKVTQSCLTLCDPLDYMVHGLLQVRILEWVAFPFSRDLPNPGIEPRSPALQVNSYQLSHKGSPWITKPVLIRCTKNFSD